MITTEVTMGGRLVRIYTPSGISAEEAEAISAGDYEGEIPKDHWLLELEGTVRCTAHRFEGREDLVYAVRIGDLLLGDPAIYFVNVFPIDVVTRIVDHAEPGHAPLFVEGFNSQIGDTGSTKSIAEALLLWSVRNLVGVGTIIGFEVSFYDPKAYAEWERTHASIPAPQMVADRSARAEPAPAPIPMLLWCPGCGERHIDVGEFATKVHTTHACQHCGMCWRPAVVATCGVQFLPGFKNEEA